MSEGSSMDLEAEFARTWVNPTHTSYELPDVDVNEVLAERYVTNKPLLLTGTMLWDMEVRKAANPGDYIPNTVLAGSAHAWGRQEVEGGAEHLVRSSRQRLWLRPDEYGTVLERVHLNHMQQKVTFIGTAELTGPDGNLILADAEQPLFHVEHSVGGTESRPLNRWRIVHLTDAVDPHLLRRFSDMAKYPWLAEYVEIYIRRDLGIELGRSV
jgi:hypothetical protein